MRNFLRFTRLNTRELYNKVVNQTDKIRGEYNDDVSDLSDQYEKSRALYVQSNVDWLNDNLEMYKKETNKVKELSFGLLPGVHLELLKEGRTIKDLISRASNFPEYEITKYIWNDMKETHSEVLLDALTDLIEYAYVGEDEREEWHKKWDKYLEEE